MLLVEHIRSVCPTDISSPCRFVVHTTANKFLNFTPLLPCLNLSHALCPVMHHVIIFLPFLSFGITAAVYQQHTAVASESRGSCCDTREVLWRDTASASLLLYPPASPAANGHVKVQLLEVTMYSPEGHYRPYSSQKSRDRRQRRPPDPVSEIEDSVTHLLLQGEGRQGPSFPLQETSSRAETPASQSSHRRTLSSQRDSSGIRTPGSQRDGGLRTLGSQRDGGVRTPGSQRDGGARTPGSQKGGRRSPGSQRTVRREDLGRRSSSQHRVEEPPSPTSSWRSRGIPVAPSSSLLTSLTSQVSQREQHAALVQASPRPLIKKQKKDPSCVCRLPSVFKVTPLKNAFLTISGGNIFVPVGGWHCMSGGLAATARGGGDRGEGSRGQVCGAWGGRQEGTERQDQGHLQARSH